MCQRKQKFLTNFYQVNVTAKCLPENKWNLPEQWGTCVESKQNLKPHIFIFPLNTCIGKVLSLWFFYLSFSATECPLPPSPPAGGGNVIVRNSGLYFGTICPGAQSYESLPGSGTN